MKKTAIMLLLIAISSIGAKAQTVNTYAFAQTTGTYTAIAGTTILAAGNDDTESGLTNIGFTFTYHGVAYTQFSASPNGYICLGIIPSATTTPLSSETNCIAFAGGDGKTNGAVTYLLSGTSPNRILTIQYPNWYVYWNATTETLNAQIKLYESTNIVEIIYGASARTTTYTRQSGINGAAVSDFSIRTATTSWATSTTAVANTATMTWSTAYYPANGQVYRWTPPCTAISTLPWTENFNGVTIPAFPSCWYKENGDWVTTNNGNSTYDADAKSGTQFLRNSWSATNEYIWTPGFNLTAGVSYNFSFWWAGDTYAGWTGDVFYNTSQVSTGATQMGASFVTDGTTTTKNYDNVIRTFVPSASGTYYFAIRVNCPTSTPWYLSFDDFNLKINELTVPVTGNNSYTVCSGNIYDNGGSTDIYSASSNGYTTIYPGTAGNVIQLTGSYYTEANYDSVCIYNGVGVGGIRLFVGSTSALTTIPTITSTDASGALTIRFISDGSVQNAGFDFTINCIVPCTNSNVPYIQDFESIVIPAIPGCTSIQNAGSGNNWETANPSDYGFLSKALRYTYHSTNAANTWFFTNGLNLTGGVSYKITFRYGNTGATFPEKLKVAYGNSATAASMTTPLLDFPTINQGSPQNATYNFTPVLTGVYYVGFNAYSDADMFYLFVDDISVDLTSALPISLISFTGKCDDGKVTLDWSTATETNNSYFTVEKSDDGYNWKLVQKVNGAGNSNQQIDYSIIDQADGDITYYRLTQTDYDGKFEIFPPLATKCDNNYSNIKVYPNPTTGLLNVRSLNTEITQIEVRNSLGQIVAKFFDNLETINLSDQKPGIYLIKITDYENKNTIFKIIKE